MFVINDELTSDNVEKAEAFNSLYTSIGPSLPSSNKSPSSYIAEYNPETIYTIPVTHDEVSKIVHGLTDSIPG